eukprot:scaffold15735_cov152-Amphora_coffeaeformis.AAC.6
MAKNKKAKKKREREEKPDLYSADIGSAGIKKKKQTTHQPSNSKTLAGTLALTQEELQRRKERQSRFSGGTISVSSDPLNSALSSHRGASKKGTSASSSTSISSSTNSKGEFIGENQNLEKDYLRLTTFPRKEDVRPLSVLKKSLAHIKARYKESEDMFEWCNSQLKSVRQDITVQGIRDNFVLQVYETHARILLEHGDLNEFNQCNTMIRSLREGMLVDDSLFQADRPKSKKKKKKRCKPLQQTPEAADEFGAYAVLYAVVQRSWMSLKMELMRIQPILRRTSSNGSCQHAMSVMRAVLNNDYRSFFDLYDQAPHMSVYLMDFMLKRVRIAAYESIVAAYRPTISVDQLQEWLGFLNEAETRSFLKGRCAVVMEDTSSGETQLDCKACFAKVAT